MRLHVWRGFRWLSAGLLAASLAVFGCAKQDEVIIYTAEGRELRAADIDRDPLALLPGGAIAAGYLDAPQLFTSQFGPKLLTMIERRVPIPASAGFEPRRDLQRLYVGVYSMQGADVAGVAVGNFDPARIEQAADAQQTTPLGVPLVKSQYAGRTLYTAESIGFTVVTSRTVLFGNETGMRRTLDRIKEGRVRHEVLPWLERMLEKPGAPVIIGMDLTSQPVPRAMGAQLPFLLGLKSAGILGNFQPPGLNLAGTLTYDDATSASQGAANMTAVVQNLQSYGFLMSLLGIAQPIERLEARPQDREVAFVAEVNGQAVHGLLDMADRALPTSLAR